MTKPRVLCVMQLPPPVHGASVVNQHIAHSEILEKRFDLEVFPLRFADSIDEIGHASAKKLVRAVATTARLVRGLAVRRPDAVYFTLSPAGNAFYRDCVYVAIMKAFRVIRIYHLHGKGVSDQLKNPWKRRLYKWAFHEARVIQLSPLLAKESESLVPAKHIYFVPNGVPDSESPAGRSSAKGERPRILYLSNMIESKGPLLLVEALARLRASGIEFEATFAGASGTNGCVEAFHTAVTRFDLGNSVHYIGPVYGAAKARLYAEHDIFVLPTFYAQETFPLVVLEAMQNCLPVISTHEGAIPEIVHHGETGFLVAQRDVDDLVMHLALLLANPPMRRRMGDRGRQRYLERYTLDRFEHTLANVLADCIDADS